MSTGQGLLGNNMFAYCRNSPIFRVDVSGMEDLEADTSNPLDPEDDLRNWTCSGDQSTSGGTSGPSQASSTTPDSYNFNGSKGVSYAIKRGWSHDMITEAINAGQTGTSTNLANGADCVVYSFPGDSVQYVVLETVSRSIVQLTQMGDRSWIPDKNIIWFHRNIEK